MDMIECPPPAESHDSGFPHRLAVFSVQPNKAVLLGEGSGNLFFPFNWDLLGHQYIEPELEKYPKEWKALHEWAENGLRRHLDVVKEWKQLSAGLDYVRLGLDSAVRGEYWSYRVKDAYTYLFNADDYLHDLAPAEEFPLSPAHIAVAEPVRQLEKMHLCYRAAGTTLWNCFQANHRRMAIDYTQLLDIIKSITDLLEKMTDWLLSAIHLSDAMIRRFLYSEASGA